MRAAGAEALWCACGQEAYIHLQDETVCCPFCRLSQLRDAFGGDPECAASLDRQEALLRMRRAEEELRLVFIVHGGTV